MTGIFDSGVGGLNTLFALRRAYPKMDIALYMDKKNAPFGNKTKAELIRIVNDGILKLKDMGAARVLLGCCTASTVYELLPYGTRKYALPIIEPTARAAAEATGNKRIALLATERTVRSGAFLRAVRAIYADARLLSLSAGELVSFIEAGASDAYVPRELWERLLIYKERIEDFSADTLILGCTHFPSLYYTFKHLLPSVNVISSAEAGALSVENEETGSSKTIYIS